MKSTVRQALCTCENRPIGSIFQPCYRGEGPLQRTHHCVHCICLFAYTHLLSSRPSPPSALSPTCQSSSYVSLVLALPFLPTGGLIQFVTVGIRSAQVASPSLRQRHPIPSQSCSSETAPSEPLGNTLPDGRPHLPPL